MSNTSLDTFRTAVRNANPDSFIRLSGSRPGAIVNYGKTLLCRKLGLYRHGTELQNRQVRMQLFAALQRDGADVQAQTLARIRIDLGINEQGQSEKTTQLTAREIKRIFDAVSSDNANAEARQRFAEELRGKFSSQFHEKISQRLGLGNPEKMLQPLTEEDKAAIRHELQNEGIKAFMTVCNYMGLKDINILKKSQLPAQDINRYEEMLLCGAMTGQFSEDCLRIMMENVNDAMVKVKKHSAEEKFQQAFDQLKKETLVDVIALKDVMLEQVLEDFSSAVKAKACIVSDPNEMIDSAINTVISKCKDLIKGIQNANPKLDSIKEEDWLKLAATDVSLEKANQALCLPDCISTLNDLLEYAGSQNPSKEVFAKKLHAWDTSCAGHVKTCKAGTAGDFSAGDSYALNRWSMNLALSRFEMKHGKGPEMDATLVQFIKQLRADCDYMSEHPAEGLDWSKPYAYSEDYAKNEGAPHFRMLTNSIGEIFNIDLKKDNLPPSNGLSQDSADFMCLTGGIAKRYPDPYGKVIDQKLGSLFKERFLDLLKKRVECSTNEAMTDYRDMFSPSFRDLVRGGIGLKLGDTVISYPETGVSDENNALVKIKEFFAQDSTFGLNAARVFSDLFNQTIINSFQAALHESREACGMALGSDYAANLNVTRRSEGDYVIDFKYDVIPNKHAVGHTVREVNFVELDRSQSHLSIAFKLLLKVDGGNKKATLQISSQDANLHGELHKPKFTEEELLKISPVRNPITQADISDQVLFCPELADDEHLKKLLAPNKIDRKALFDYLKDKIVTDSDKGVLVALGMSPSQVAHLSRGLLPGTRLTKKLVLRLMGGDHVDRRAAFDELKVLCQRLVDVGWNGSAEQVDVNDLALATVDELRTNPENLRIVRAFIHASKDENIRKNLDVLGNGDEAAVKKAKKYFAAIIPQARRAMGVDLLKTLSGQFSSKDIEMLKAAPEQERVKGYLEAIVLKNDEMEPAISALESYVKELTIINQENPNA